MCMIGCMLVCVTPGAAKPPNKLPPRMTLVLYPFSCNTCRAFSSGSLWRSGKSMSPVQEGGRVGGWEGGTEGGCGREGERVGEGGGGRKRGRKERRKGGKEGGRGGEGV